MDQLEPIEIFDSVNKQQIKVYVASDVAKRCRKDNGFAQDLFRQLQEQNIEEGSVLEIKTVKTETSWGSDAEEVDTDFDVKLEPKESWSRQDTLKLIKLYKKYKDKLENPVKRKTAWNLISHELLSHYNIYRDPEKCKQKWKNLMRTYNTVCEKGIITRFHFFKEINDVITDNTVNITLGEDLNNSIGTKISSDFLNTSISLKEEIPEKEMWSRSETLKLLKAYQLRKNDRKYCTNDKEFWLLITRELAKLGVKKPYIKCANKWKNLMRTYKVNANKSGAPLRFNYFQEVDDVLKDREIILPSDLQNLEMEYMGLPNMSDAETSEIVAFGSNDDDLHRDNPVCWMGVETIKLINTYKKHRHRFKHRPKRYVWGIIAADLATQGVNKEEEKCINKWKSLLRSYRKVGNNNNPRFYFLDAMREALADDCNLTEGIEDVDDNDNTMEYEESDRNLIEDEHSEDKNNIEQIIIETEHKKSDIENHNYSWLYNETMALIRAYAMHKRKSPTDALLWSEISEDLKKDNIFRTPQMCEKKWNSLYSIYNSQKLLNIGTDKFIFFNAVDEICNLEKQEQDNVNVVFGHKCKYTEKKLKEKQKRHLERMQMLERKLDIEERKVKAFEDYVNYLKTDGLDGKLA